ncbi:MAG: DUF6266 family protein [Bacteroidia bacterium]
MATIKNGIHGAFSGKVGTVIGYVLNGQAIMRTQGERTTEPTPKELLNREKFTVSQKWLAPLTDFLRIGFKGYRPTFEGFVAAKSYNHKHALQCTEENQFFIDPELVLVSFGQQPLPAEIAVESREAQELFFSWSKEKPYEYNDHVMALAYDLDSPQGKARYHTSIGLRKDGSAVFKLEPSDKGRAFHIYIAFVSDDRKQRTHSKYLGKLTII